MRGMSMNLMKQYLAFMCCIIPSIGNSKPISAPFLERTIETLSLPIGIKSIADLEPVGNTEIKELQTDIETKEKELVSLGVDLKTVSTERINNDIKDIAKEIEGKQLDIANVKPAEKTKLTNLQKELKDKLDKQTALISILDTVSNIEFDRYFQSEIASAIDERDIILGISNSDNKVYYLNCTEVVDGNSAKSVVSFVTQLQNSSNSLSSIKKKNPISEISSSLQEILSIYKTEKPPAPDIISEIYDVCTIESILIIKEVPEKFALDFLKGLSKEGVAAGDSKQPSGKIVSSSLLGITQAEFLTGLSDFILQRGLLEIKNYVEAKVFRKLCDNSNFSDFIVKPSSVLYNFCTLNEKINEILKEPSQLSNIIPAIKDAMQRDLVHFPMALSVSLAESGDPSIGGADKDFLLVFALLGRILEDSAYNQKDFVKIIYNIENADLNNDQSTDGPLISSLSDLKDHPNARPTCNQNPYTSNLYWSLAIITETLSDSASEIIVVKKESSYLFFASVSIYLNSVHKQYTGLKNTLNWLPADSEQCVVFTIVSTLETTTSKDKFINWIKTLSNVIEEVGQISDKVDKIKNTESEKSLNYIEMFEHIYKLSNIGISIYCEENPKNKFCTNTKDQIDGIVGIFFKLTKSIVTKKRESFVEALNDIEKLLKNSQAKINPDLVRIMVFILDISEAETAEEVQAALESFAAPPGSYASKREKLKNTDRIVYFKLNAYLGFDAGFEFVENPTTGKISLTDNFDPSVAVGVTTPVGVEFGFKHRKVTNPDKKYIVFGNKGILVSAINLGSLVSLRLDPNETSANDVSNLPTPNFKTVFAPGGFFIVGLGRTPLSLGFGGQFNPDARTVETDPDIFLDTFKFSGFLGVDVPIFP
jgi:hypothetical protein